MLATLHRVWHQHCPALLRDACCVEMRISIHLCVGRRQPTSLNNKLILVVFRWPEDWSKPVGYHVTVPCHKDETGYRTFDTAFAVDRGNDGELEMVYMVYENDVTRDVDRYHSHFGTAGVCRSGQYGMPQYVTNTMRVCTSSQSGVEYDPSVPVTPKTSSPTEMYGEEQCSENPFDTPWWMPDGERDPSMMSVGNVPSWHASESWSTTITYPATKVLSRPGPGPAGDMSWGMGGAGCGPDDPLFCRSNADCVPLSGTSASMECFRGLCVLGRAATQTCYSHVDCYSQNKLCAGDGRCAEGVWEVENKWSGDVEFQLYSEECKSSSMEGLSSSETYTTVGTSPWESVPDVLELYGMCSYRGWFEYLEFVDPINATLHKNLGLCKFDPNSRECTGTESDSRSSLWWDTDRNPDVQLQTLWTSGRFQASLDFHLTSFTSEIVLLDLI